MIRLVIIDEDHQFCIGIKKLLAETKLEIIGEATNWKEGAELIKNQKPDIVILDVNFSDASGIHISEFIHRNYPTTKSIFLTNTRNLLTLSRLLQTPTCGLLLKSSIYFLIEAIRTVYSGKKYIQPDLSFEIIKYQYQRTTQNINKLTSKEYDVLKMIALGIDLEKIAEKCFISSKTVSNIKSNSMKKLGIKSLDQIRKLFS